MDAEDGRAKAAEAPLVRFVDVGCGFGGLLIRLSPLFPDTLMLGLELRDKVRMHVPNLAVMSAVGQACSTHLLQSCSMQACPLQVLPLQRHNGASEQDSCFDLKSWANDPQVSEYVKERVLAMRREKPGEYGNIACLRTNAQKHLVHYFRKGQLAKLFFLFPVCAILHLANIKVSSHTPALAWHCCRGTSHALSRYCECRACRC
jgi:tRNA (guanine-N7-)-methyltransferase